MPSSASVRSSPHAPSEALSRDSIVAAAIELLGDSGVEGFNMRALADRLGVTPGALYRHIGGKEAVLAEAAEAIVSAMQVADDPRKPWQERWVDMAWAYRRTCARYPGMSAFLGQHILDIAANRRLLEHSRQLLLHTGLGEEDMLTAAKAINVYIGASVGPAPTRPAHQRGRRARPAADAPQTGLSDADFEFGIRLFLRGLTQGMTQGARS